MEPKEPQYPHKEVPPKESGRRELKERTAEVLAPIKFEAMALADSFRRTGFPKEMAAEMAAHWASRDMGSAGIDDKVWKSLGAFVQTNIRRLHSPRRPASHDDLMGMALELNLTDAIRRQPEIPEGANEDVIRDRQKQVSRILESGALNPLQPDEPYRSLEELAQDYENFAAAHGTTAATDLWLATRKVRIPHLREQAVRGNPDRTETGIRTKLFSEVHDYLANRYQQKYQTLTAIEQPVKQEQTFSSLDELYQAYKRYRDEEKHQQNRGQEISPQQWIQEQRIDLPHEEQRRVKRVAIELTGENILKEEAAQEEKALLKLLSTRYEAERYQALKARAEEIAAQQRLESQNQEQQPEKHISKTDLAYDIIIPPILPLLDEILAENDPKNTGYDEILETVIEQWDAIKAAIPDAEEEWSNDDATSSETNTPQDNLAFAIWKKHLAENSQRRRAEKKAAEEAAKKEGFLARWKKKLFGG